MNSKLVKIASALAAININSVDAREMHPLQAAGPNVNTVVSEDGGISMRLHKNRSTREKSHAEIQAGRQ